MFVVQCVRTSTAEFSQPYFSCFSFCSFLLSFYILKKTSLEFLFVLSMSTCCNRVVWRKLSLRSVKKNRKGKMKWTNENGKQNLPETFVDVANECVGTGFWSRSGPASLAFILISLVVSWTLPVGRPGSLSLPLSLFFSQPRTFALPFLPFSPTPLPSVPLPLPLLAAFPSFFSIPFCFPLPSPPSSCFPFLPFLSGSPFSLLLPLSSPERVPNTTAS